MLLIPLFLLLCGCAQTGGNISHAPEGGTASTQTPPHNISSPVPEGSSADLDAPSASERPSSDLDALPAPERFSADLDALPASERPSSDLDASSAPERSSTDLEAPPASERPSSDLDAPSIGTTLLPQMPTSSHLQTLPQAGISSVENLIFTALEPVGSTMYVWGGGWNEADTGAGPEALSIGCSKRWAEFAAAQDSDYDYHNFRYRIHDGLDCSGYIGWILYNLFHTENSQSESDGYVMKSSLMAKTLADYGWGELIPASAATEWKPGDICSMSGHVWLSLGMCQDGSVLLLHASPPGVRICGTASSDGEKTDAVILAEKWMSECYPDWYAKFPKCDVNNSYLTTSDIMRWNSDTLDDAERFQAMSAEETATYFMPELY